jgi:predicted O-methyltransferase YrrM
VDEVIERLLADPPSIHELDTSAKPRHGLWSSATECYRYLAVACHEGSRTLETGSGLSTVLFALLRTEHICITPVRAEVDRILAYCSSHAIDVSAVEFIVDKSSSALPGLNRGPLDLVLIDGSHGFPVPIIDWFFAGAMLRQSGVIVVDDLNLPSVSLVREFLDADQRWVRHQRAPTWGSWARISTGGLDEDWWEQPFYRPSPRLNDVPVRAAHLLRRAVRRLR